MKFVIAAFVCACTLGLVASNDAKKLFDFNNDPYSLYNWMEHSDVQYKNGAGASKARIVFLKNESGRRAAFFGLANAQAYSAGTAIVRASSYWDLSEYSSILINCRADIAEGQFNIVLRHKGIIMAASNVYLAAFEPTSEFSTIEIPLSSFVSKWSEDEALDTSYISSIGIGFIADSGEIDVGVLEINWIAVQ